MPVNEKIKLNIISNSEMRKAEQQVLKLEDLARRGDRASIKVANLRGTRITASRAPIQTSNPGERSGIFAGIRANTPFKSKDTTSQQAVHFDSRFTQLEKKVQDQSYKIMALNKVVSLMSPVMRGASLLTGSIINPVGTLQGTLLGLSAKIPFIGLGIGAGMGLAEYLYTTIVATYGPGMQRDVRKTQLNSTLSYLGTEKDDLLFGGDSLFLGDPTTHKGVLHTTSNTQNIKDGMRRYNLRTSPYWR